MQIKPKDYEKAFVGKSPFVIQASELFRHSMLNLNVNFSAQQTNIISLFEAFNIP